MFHLAPINYIVYCFQLNLWQASFINFSILNYFRFLHPITYGDYPLSMRYLVGARLPDFTTDDTALLKNSYDFLGLNYYTTAYALNAPNPLGTRPSYGTDSQVHEICK